MPELSLAEMLFHPESRDRLAILGEVGPRYLAARTMQQELPQAPYFCRPALVIYCNALCLAAAVALPLGSDGRCYKRLSDLRGQTRPLNETMCSEIASPACQGIQ